MHDYFFSIFDLFSDSSSLYILVLLPRAGVPLIQQRARTYTLSARLFGLKVCTHTSTSEVKGNLHARTLLRLLTKLVNALVIAGSYSDAMPILGGARLHTALPLVQPTGPALCE